LNDAVIDGQKLGAHTLSLTRITSVYVSQFVHISLTKSTTYKTTDTYLEILTEIENIGRYYDKVITDTAGFKAWWKTVAAQFKSNDKVVFDTNNEYHDMDNALVAQLNQAAIDGIRAAGATTQYIFVEGNSWSGAWHWVKKLFFFSLPSPSLKAPLSFVPTP